ncbi:MAG: hypothetical protein M3N31_09390 [Actinomycetota bacterium]|nr:hypothetical protein [Actinomycetota bacterium]
MIREHLSAEPDIQLLDDLAQDGALLLAAARRTRPDVVVLGTEERRLPAVIDDLLTEHPNSRALTVTASGDEASLFQLRPHQVRLGEVSPKTLVQAIRTG